MISLRYLNDISKISQRYWYIHDILKILSKWVGVIVLTQSLIRFKICYVFILVRKVFQPAVNLVILYQYLGLASAGRKNPGNYLYLYLYHLLIVLFFLVKLRNIQEIIDVIQVPSLSLAKPPRHFTGFVLSEGAQSQKKQTQWNLKDGRCQNKKILFGKSENIAVRAASTQARVTHIASHSRLPGLTPLTATTNQSTDQFQVGTPTDRSQIGTHLLLLAVGGHLNRSQVRTTLTDPRLGYIFTSTTGGQRSTKDPQATRQVSYTRWVL